MARSLVPPSPSAALRSGLLSRNYAAAARPRNDAIPFSYVRLVDRSGQLTAPQSLKAVLNDRRREGKKLKEAVELVQTTPEPIVKYVDVSADYWKQKELHKKQVVREGTHKEKEIQMTWAVSESDAAHKLKVARQALQQGQKVHIVYTYKKGQSRLSPEEMMARLEATVERLNDVGKAPKTPTVMPTGMGVVNMEPAGTNPPA